MLFCILSRKNFINLIYSPGANPARVIYSCCAAIREENERNDTTPKKLILYRKVGGRMQVL